MFCIMERIVAQVRAVVSESGRILLFTNNLHTIKIYCRQPEVFYGFCEYQSRI